MTNFTITPGLPQDQIDTAAALFWGAFGAKLRIPMGPESRALGFLRDVIDPAHAISALGPDGTLLGVAGFKSSQGAFVGGEFGDLRRHYGLLGCLWRAVLLSLLERNNTEDILLMDGIFVSSEARGQGVGTALLDAVADHARANGLAQVRLDVIDTNPRARALYERRGFRAVKTETLGPLRHLFGFNASTEMRLDLPR